VPANNQQLSNPLTSALTEVLAKRISLGIFSFSSEFPELYCLWLVLQAKTAPADEKRSDAAP
jgi:hypothetical protein